MHRPYLSRPINDENTIVLVADNGTIDGFIIARTGSAPPVYDSGGLTTTVDDFMVRNPDLWPTMGRALLDQVWATVEERGAVQVIVVCGSKDEHKRRMLREASLGVASKWFVRQV